MGIPEFNNQAQHMRVVDFDGRWGFRLIAGAGGFRRPLRFLSPSCGALDSGILNEYRSRA